MRLRLILFLVITFVDFSFASAQHIGNSILEADTIPFILTDENNISIQTIVNDTDTLLMMLHTDIHSVSLVPDVSSQIKHKKSINSTSAKSWSGTKNVNYTEGNSLKIGDLEWDNIQIWLNMLSGKQTDGKFGLNLFAGKLIEIDYQKNIIVLHPTLENIKLDNFNKHNLTTNENNSLFIEGEFKFGDAIVKNKFLIHSGYGGSIILDDQFCKTNEFIKSLPVIEEKQLKDSFGNIIQTKNIVVEKFRIYNTAFSNVPISYFASEIEIQKTSIVGTAFLKRFNIIIDRANLNIYTKPNKNTYLPFD